NHLKRIGLAFLSHHDTMRIFPTAGRQYWWRQGSGSPKKHREAGRPPFMEELEPRYLLDLNVHDDIYRVATLPATTATLTGTSELHVTGTGDPIPGSVINLNSSGSWFFLDNILPSTIASSFLSRVRVHDAPAVLDSNVRVAQYDVGGVVIPQGPSFTPLTV